MKKLNIWRGIKNPQFKPIIANKDEKGRILTYTVKGAIGGKYDKEVNTLKEARLWAYKE